MKKRLLLAPLLCLFFVCQLQAQTTRTAGNYTALTSAITASSDGDIISITGNIVVTTAVSNSKTIIINGNGYSITVPVTGLDASGKFNASPSGFRVFTLTGTGKTTTINNLTISGGYSTTLTGAAISVGSGHTLKINHSTISNSRGGTSGGGGLDNNGGTVYMYNCEIMRNAANYGGGFLNRNSGKMFVEKCTFSENRSTFSAGGGGAGENNGASTYLYVNNSTFSNNKSTEIGGAINNAGGNIYIVNSSLTGNVAYGDYKGGAIGNNNGTVYAVNCLFAYNYRRSSGTTANPTTYVLDDVEANGSPGNVHLRYCIYHADLTSSGVDYGTGHNINYTGAADGSDNTIFSGGSYTRITDGTGVEIGHLTTGKVYQPFLYDNAGDITPTLKTGSFILQSGNLGAKTGFTNGSGTPVIGYYDRLAGSPAWVNLVGSPASSYVVTSDQIGTTRTDPPSVGAIQSIVENLYMLKVNYSADGSVDGGVLYGNVYPSGTSVELVALPNAGKQFVRWDYVVGGTGTASTNNPYTVLVDKDITLVPIFQNQPVNTYGLTYVGNGITSGTVPASGNFTGSSTIASVGTMKRSGYIFNGWNTRANGTGTAYSGGATYTPSPAANLILYAQWNDNLWRGTTSTDFATGSNWGSGTVPATGADIVFAEDATKNLVLDMNRQVGNVQFSGANYKLELGNYNLTATGVTNNSSTRYIQTSGTGTLCISVANNAATLFPIGNSAYNPVTIENKTGAADVFCSRVLDELYSNGTGGTAVTEPRVKRTWDISKDNPNAGAGVNFVFNWNAGETVSLTTPALFHYGSSWVKQTAGTTSYTSNSLTYTGYTGTFSPFGIADANSILPVTWLNFEVQKQNDHALLVWTTAGEINNKDFVVEHSMNGKDWKSIGVVKGALNSFSSNTYQFIHDHPSEGINYYRLRQRDLDGRNSFSSVQTVKFEPKAALVVYPNPVEGGVLHVRVAKAGMLKMYTGNGQLILQKKLTSSGQYSVNLSHVAKGVYRLAFDNKTISIVLQ